MKPADARSRPSSAEPGSFAIPGVAGCWAVQSCGEGACGVVEPAQQSDNSAGRCGALALLLGLSVAACKVVSSVACGLCGFGRAVGSGVVVSVV